MCLDKKHLLHIIVMQCVDKRRTKLERWSIFVVWAVDITRLALTELLFNDYGEGFKTFLFLVL